MGSRIAPATHSKNVSAIGPISHFRLEMDDGFELHVHERCLHQYGQVFLLAMQKLFEGVQAFRHLLRRWRNKCCVAGPRGSDPVLGLAEFTRTLQTATPLGQRIL